MTFVWLMEETVFGISASSFKISCSSIVVSYAECISVILINFLFV
jgi:hypothetical protein